MDAAWAEVAEVGQVHGGTETLYRSKVLVTALLSAFQSGVSLWEFVERASRRMVANERLGQ